MDYRAFTSHGKDGYHVTVTMDGSSIGQARFMEGPDLSRHLRTLEGYLGRGVSRMSAGNTAGAGMEPHEAFIRAALKDRAAGAVSPRRKKPLTLCIIREGRRVLLGMKKTGFGAGKWNGFGGKVEKGETIARAAAREVLEECGLRVARVALRKAARLLFTFAGEDELMDVHVYLAGEFTGVPVETAEMRPQWFPLNRAPYESMWLDDRFWLPLVLKGGKVIAQFLFEGTEKLLAYSIETVGRFSRGVFPG